MAVAKTIKTGAKGDETRDRVKSCARELFARMGIDNVTIRDIAKHSGQRNGGSVNYYFGTKEDLVKEIIEDAAREADEMRGLHLDRLEGSGEPITMRAVLKVLISSEGHESEEKMRLFTMLQIYRRDLLHAVIPGRWDNAYRRCLVHLTKLLPQHPEDILVQRMYFLIPYLWTFLATREGGKDQARFWVRFWSDPAAIENMLDTAEGMLIWPSSPDTLLARASRKPG